MTLLVDVEELENVDQGRLSDIVGTYEMKRPREIHVGVAEFRRVDKNESRRSGGGHRSWYN